MVQFYGFKLHLVTNHLIEIIAAKPSPANPDDRKPVRELSKGLLNKLYAEEGYISKALAEVYYADYNAPKEHAPKVQVAQDRAM